MPQADVVADVVAPGAAHADADGVQRSTLEALAQAGLLGAALVPAVAQRELSELLAGSDASTWFCWVQHQTPLRTLEGSVAGLESGASDSLRRELLPGMRDGSLVGAVAFAHVRRPGAPNPVATRVPGGWRFDGTLDWVTSWDVADVVMVMARGAGDDAGRLVCAYLPGRARGGSHPGTDGRSAAGPARHGRHAHAAGRPRRVVVHGRSGRRDHGRGHVAGGRRTADVRRQPGRLRHRARRHRGARVLAAERARPGPARPGGAPDSRVPHVARARPMRSPTPTGRWPTRLGARAQSLDLAGRAATAVVVARAGAAMRRGSSAERRLREAMFLQVQAQTRESRDASLAHLADRSRRAQEGDG